MTSPQLLYRLKPHSVSIAARLFSYGIDLTTQGIVLRRAFSRAFFSYDSIRHVQLISAPAYDYAPSSPLIPILIITVPDTERPQDIAYYQDKEVQLQTYPDDEIRTMLQVLVEKCPGIYFNNQSLEFLNDKTALRRTRLPEVDLV